jgi:MSHA biogenesis protein MshE
MKTTFKKVKIGEVLLKLGFINEEQLQKALGEQKEKGIELGDALVQLGYIDQAGLGTALANQLKIPYIDLKHYQIKPDIIRKIPERVARRHRSLLLDIQGEYLIGMSDPTDLLAFDELHDILGAKLRIAVVTEDDVMRVIDMVYRRTADIVSFAAELKEELGKGQSALRTTDAEVIGAEAAPVAKLLDSIFEDAVQVGASDIHIEPDEKFLRIRQRIDGVLHEHIVHGKEIVSALVLRIKLIANLNISEKRLPQDGRFHINVKDHSIDVRVSTMPVYYGESVVMRLLDKSGGLLKLEQLGMPEKVLTRFMGLVHQPNGMILVTGPTGSGKTTSLYAALNDLNVEGKKIITIEDPIEYTLPRVNQVQVNTTIGLTFSQVLRSALRQDPDVVMVGEMRDEDTVEIGLRAAMTGHLVLSTLHTNDSISSATRLIDMGAQGFLVAGALRGVIAQRLIRRICAICITNYNPNKQELAWIEGLFPEAPSLSFQLKQGLGCSRCNQTGYRGRIGIYELLEISGELADVLRTNDARAFSAIAQQQPHFRSLAHAALEYALEGVSSLSEVFRIAGEVSKG